MDLIDLDRFDIRGVNLSIPHAFTQFKNHWKETSWWYFQFTNYIISKFFQISYVNRGTYIMEEDWDNLIILDACRYDLFREKIKNSQITGILERRISRGSSTMEFLIENFRSRKSLLDIVYVTANPFVELVLNNHFYKIENVWIDSWNENLATVHPKDVIEATLKAYNDYPHKRLIIHFMQPHSPPIGSYRIKGDFVQLAMSKDGEKLMRAYASNLDFVLIYIKKLLDKIDGKTVITSDHGEAFGERTPFFRIPIFGHPNGVYISSLVEVPWLKINCSRRPRTKEKITMTPQDVKHIEHYVNTHTLI